MTEIDSPELGVGAWPLAQAGLAASLFLILLAQPGFMLFVAGAGSRKNAIAALYRSLAGVSVAALAFMLFGRELQSGAGPIADLLRRIAPQLGQAAPIVRAPAPGFALQPLIDVAAAMLAYVVAASTTIGRTTPLAAMMFAALFAGLLYPLATFALTHPDSPLFGLAPLEAGAARLHLVGAGAALAGALSLGPRLGFNGYDPLNLGQDRMFRVAASHAPHHAPMAAQGAFLIGLGLVGVSLAALFSELAAGAYADGRSAAGAGALEVEARLAGRLTMLFLAAIGGVATMVVAQAILRRDLELMDLLCAALAGLAASAAALGAVSEEGALAIGAIGGLLARLGRGLFAALSIDDPVATVSTHGVAAIVGVGLCELAAAGPDAPWRAISGGELAAAAARAGFALAVFVGAFALSLLLYRAIELICKILAVLTRRASLREALRANQLRIDYEAEIFGLDETRHGQDAYSFRPSR